VGEIFSAEFGSSVSAASASCQSVPMWPSAYSLFASHDTMSRLLAVGRETGGKRI
jgi:hypothetical protein